MKRRIISAAAAWLLLLALAGPVGAWSAISVSISGGSGGAVSGTGEDLVPALLVTRALPDRPAGDLGPRYEATYTLGPGGDVLARQDLYPYASGGPAAYSATDGSVAGHPFGAGWRQADPSILKVLVSWGLPNAPDLAATSPARSPSAGMEPGTLALVAALAALVFVGSLAGLRFALERGRARTRRIA